jgi:hypothetical protein
MSAVEKRFSEHSKRARRWPGGMPPGTRPRQAAEDAETIAIITENS